MAAGDLFALPFLHRKMLDFEQGTVIALSLNVVTQVSGAIQVRGFTKQGPFTYEVIPAASGATENFVLQLPDFPIAVSVTRNVAVSALNATYVMVRLRLNGDDSFTLCAGYPDSNKGVSYPSQIPPDILVTRGSPYTYAVSAPAVGNDWTDTLPANTFREVKSVTMRLVAAASAGNRRVILRATTGGAEIFSVSAPAPIIISQTSILTFGQGLNATDDQTSFYQQQAIPAGLLLGPSTILRSQTTNIAGGDQFGIVKVTVQEYVMA